MADTVLNNLPYIKTKESHDYHYLELPVVLFQDPRFSGLTSDAIVLYSLLLNRVSLSIKNGWIDENNNVFIYFSRDEAAEFLHFGKDKIISLFKQLIKYGLIEEKRQGLQKPNIIYVKSFRGGFEEPIPGKREDEETGKDVSNPCNFSEVGNSEFKKSEIQNSGSRDFRVQEVGNSDANNPYINNLNINNPDLVSIYPSGINVDRAKYEKEKIDRLDFKNKFLANIDFDFLIRTMRVDKACIQNLVDIVVDAIRQEFISVAGSLVSKEDFIERMLTLTSEDILYALETISKASNVRNPISYALATMWNAKNTGGLYYQMQYNTDFANGGAYKVDAFLEGALASKDSKTSS